MPVPRGRRRNAPGIQLQPRDRNALLTLYYCDGLMSEEQLLRYCYRGVHEKNASKRLLSLFDNRYLNRNWRPEKWTSYPRLVYWMAQQGFDEVFSLFAERGIEVKHDTRNVDVSSWKPLTLDHHLEVNDIFLKVLMDLEEHSQLTLRSWVGDAYFRSQQWKGLKPWNGKVKIEGLKGKLEAKEVRPDGFFKIIRYLDENKKEVRIRGFILEVDRGNERQTTYTKGNKVTIEEKLKKGAALVDGSPLFRHAFWLKTARCLMVTTSWERAENMMELARESKTAWAWYFTTRDVVNNPKTNILTDEIWRKADQPQPVSLIEM